MMNVRWLHRLWLGPAEMPERYVEFGLRWQELNPGWRVTTWTSDMLNWEIRNEQVLDHLWLRAGQKKTVEWAVQAADVIAYDLVCCYGGVYVNCDIDPVKPLDDLFDVVGGSAWASLENDEDGRIVNAAFGAGRPRNPFWIAVTDALGPRYWENPGAEMVETTGPALLTDVAHQRDDLVVLPVETWNPIHWKQIPPGEHATYDRDEMAARPGVFGVHGWGHRHDQRSNTVS